MTKIVVVVGNNKELFEGNIEARTNEGGSIGSYHTPDEPVLFIYDLNNKDKQIASFIKYDYWRYTD